MSPFNIVSSLSSLSSLSPASLTLGTLAASPPKLPAIPTLAELRKHAEGLQGALPALSAANMPSLPAYSSFGSALGVGAGVGAGNVIGSGSIPRVTLDPSGTTTTTTTTSGTGTGTSSDPRSDPCLNNVPLSPSPPPSYSAIAPSLLIPPVARGGRGGATSAGRRVGGRGQIADANADGGEDEDEVRTRLIKMRQGYGRLQGVISGEGEAAFGQRGGVGKRGESASWASGRVGRVGRKGV